VNYYRRFMGDYQRDTGHLSLTEHGVYTVLLDHYYSKHSPLPASLDTLYRLCRATTKYDEDAVKTVADEFFPQAEDGLRHNQRADRELMAWERLAHLNRERGKLGGRPRKKPGGLLADNQPGAGKPGGLLGENHLGYTNQAKTPSDGRHKNPAGYEAKTPPTPTPDTDSGGVLEDSDSRPQKRTAAATFHEQVIAVYHQLLPELPAVKVWSKKRRQALEARIHERCKDGKRADTIAYWRSLFECVAASDFLCGRGRSDFRADLEWLLRPENFMKVIEGRYNSRRANNGGDRASR
jgi:uncharacterized protein YdaU (DUF1376 family)